MKASKVGLLCGLAVMVVLSQPVSAVSVHSGVVIGGMVVDEFSQPLVGVHPLDLRLYQSVGDTIPVYLENHSVLFESGVFSVTLGPVPAIIDAEYLRFSVASGPGTQPWLPLQPIPSADITNPGSLDVLAFDRDGISGAAQFRGSLLLNGLLYDSVSAVPYVVTGTGQVLYTGSALNVSATGGIFDLALGSLPSGLAPGDPDRLLRLDLTAKYQDIPVLINSFEMPLTFTSSNARIELLHLSAATVPVPPAVWLFGSGLLGLLGIARHRRN